MIIKVEVDLDEIWSDGEKSLNEEFISSVKQQVLQTLKSEYKDSINEQIESELKKLIPAKYKELFKTEFEQFVKNGKTRRNGYSSELIPVEQYMQEYFTNNGCYGTFNTLIKDYAESFSKKLKERYDLAFAAQIVNKMSEQGLLKDDKLKELLG